jgi:hypothetical protein
MPIDAVIFRALSQPTAAGRAYAWAMSLSDHQRSVYLRRGDIPRAYFQALRRSLTPLGTARVYADKIADFRQLHPKLSEERDRFLLKLLAVMESGAAFRGSPDGISRDEMLALAAEGRRLFPDRADQRALFLIVPTRTDSTATEPSLINRLASWLLSVVPSSTAEALEAFCDCSSQYPEECDAGQHCCTDSGCTVGEFIVDADRCYPHGTCYDPGCGPLNLEACDGTCYPDIE